MGWNQGEEQERRGVLKELSVPPGRSSWLLCEPQMSALLEQHPNPPPREAGECLGHWYFPDALENRLQCCSPAQVPPVSPDLWLLLPGGAGFGGVIWGKSSLDPCFFCCSCRSLKAQIKAATMSPLAKISCQRKGDGAASPTNPTTALTSGAS